MQKRVLAVYFSIIRRRAIWAVDVMASASSRIMSLKEAMEVLSEGLVMLNICFVPALMVSQRWKAYAGLQNGLAKVLICSRTTSMPLSSLALSSSTICRMFLLPYIRRARAKTVDVFPVPGGPYRRRCGNRFRPVSFSSGTFLQSTYICIDKLVDCS